MRGIGIGLALVVLLAAGQAMADPIVSLSIKTGPGTYSQSIAVDPGDTVTLVFRVTNVTDLAGWNGDINKAYNYQEGGVPLFQSVTDGLPGWSAAASGHTDDPYYYRANSYSFGAGFSGTGEMGLITIKPMSDMILTGQGFDLVNSLSPEIPYTVGDVTVTINTPAFVIPEPFTATFLASVAGVGVILSRRQRKP